MNLSKVDIYNLDKIKRINLINSITGIKPVLLIGTKCSDGITNLGIFSSIVHISSKPPLIGFFVRCNKEIRRNTFDNIINQKVYTLNHIHSCNVKEAHYTSIKFDKDISEFDKCNFTEHYIEDFPAPFVKESQIRFGMRLKEIVDLNSSRSKLIVGEVENIFTKDLFLEDDFTLNLADSESVSISGLNHYYLNKKLVSLPYARESHILKH
jgi:flavin reductase (DIM6/NTAB) family NADH-FMN oxidoreductase RutF